MERFPGKTARCGCHETKAEKIRDGNIVISCSLFLAHLSPAGGHVMPSCIALFCPKNFSAQSEPVLFCAPDNKRLELGGSRQQKEGHHTTLNELNVPSSQRDDEKDVWDSSTMTVGTTDRNNIKGIHQCSGSTHLNTRQ